MTPQWVELRLPSGRLVGKYDPQRHLLQVRFRGEQATFDLAEISAKSAEGDSQDERQALDRVIASLTDS